MKRVMSIVVGIGLLLFGWSSFRWAHADSTRCGLEEYRVSVVARSGEGHPFVSLDDLGETPFIDPATGETIVPLRPLTSILSSPSDVDWNEESRTAQFRFGTHLLTVQIPESGETQAQLDGSPYPLRAYVCDGRIHAPLRNVTNAFGLEVRWYPIDRTAVVDPAWTAGTHTNAATIQPTPQRPAACNTASGSGVTDMLTHPLDAWNRTVRRTACSLIV